MIIGSGIFRTQLPAGFKAAGINCGVRVYRPDLGAIISEFPATTVGVFTKNQLKAAPVKYAEHCLPSNQIKAIITNSGEANAATGPKGEEDNLLMAEALAKALDCQPNQVITASTGVIGKPLSIEKIIEAIPSLVKRTTDIAENFATAILTTDLVPKTVYKDLILSKGTVRITGICKGSGMIHPNMATMLAYFLTDAQLDIQQSQSILKRISDKSFHMISVDGETSTNDCAFLMANGASQVALDTPSDEDIFYQAMLEMAITLAKSIARDGEGASKLIEAEVLGAVSDEQAKKVAKAIITSPLIKTAVFGESPNWGRILARMGQEDISEAMLARCLVSIQGYDLFAEGSLVESVDWFELKKQLAKDEIKIQVNFQEGVGSATAWGCDLTEKYVKINAEYVS
jgi:glutamate N-acetyltransferase/amino-acid N-acetyltransferase